MSTIEKALDQLPFGEGAFRRRFISGVIFVIILFAHSALSGWLMKGFSQCDLLNLFEKSQILLISGIFIYALGSIINTMTDGFIVRGVSITHEWLNQIFDVVPKNKGWIRGVWVTLAGLSFFVVLPVAITIGTVMSAFGFNPLYKIRLMEDQLLGQDASKCFENLPESMRDGLDEPFSDRFEAAWQALMRIVPTSHRLWINRVGTRNRDLASFLSAALLSLIVSTAIYVEQDGLDLVSLLSYMAICLISWWLLGFLSIVRGSLVSILELLPLVALDQKFGDAEKTLAT